MPDTCSHRLLACVRTLVKKPTIGTESTPIRSHTTLRTHKEYTRQDTDGRRIMSIHHEDALCDVLHDPVDARNEAVPCHTTARLDVPMATLSPKGGNW